MAVKRADVPPREKSVYSVTRGTGHDDRSRGNIHLRRNRYRKRNIRLNEK